jgi:phage virion morphogenesis protein
MINIQYDDKQVMGAMQRLMQASSRMRPAFQSIGEYLVLSIKRRFQTSTAPDGTVWAANSEATMMAMLHKRGGLSKKTGKITKRGQGLASAKKPLIGESQQLSTKIHYVADDQSVQVGSARTYAAVQQFGAKRGEFGRSKRGSPIPWGDIPARPFLGVSTEDKLAILDILEEHIEAALR